MTDLSPAAQAVLDAVFDHWPGGYNHPGKPRCVAAALRAAADQAAPELPHSELGDPEILKGIWGERRACRAELLAIAAELEGK